MLVTSRSFCQVNFGKGYFIDMNDQRIECFIRNYEWKNSPVELEYKLEEGGGFQVLKASLIKEFGIGTQSRYVSADVMIDRTGEVPEELTTERNPVWMRERLFLKVLLESETSLLYYADGNLRRFFYSSGDTVKQLIYKKYLSQGNDVIENFNFRQQLWVDARCGNVTTQEMKNVDYTRADIIKYFKDYYTCSDSEVKDFSKTAGKVAFHMKVTPGVDYSSLLLKYNANTQYKSSDVDYGSHPAFRIGLEAEIVLPYNRNKWAIVMEPSFQSFKSTNNAKEKSAKYSSFELPLGLRYYFFLGANSRLFLNGMIVVAAPVGSSYIQALDSDLPVSAQTKVSVGAGFGFRRFSGEARYYYCGDILNEYLNWTAEYNRISFIFGYRLF